MKKIVYLVALVVAIVSFTGCYADRALVYERPPVRRVMIAPAPYYYRPAPVIIHGYGRSGYSRNRFGRY